MVTRRIFILLITAFALFFTSCNEDLPELSEAQRLVEFLESADSPLQKDYVNSDLPSIIGASEVQTLNLTDNIYLIDIRSEADFNTGHIENAVNIPVGNIIDHMATVAVEDYDKIAVVCYTGQTAGFAASLLRLLGYNNVYSMKWGMAFWTATCAPKWSTNIGNTYALQFTDEASEKAAEGDLPTIDTGEEDELAILESRVSTVLADGFDAAKISAADVFANPDNYYIVNYWIEAHYTNPGHIPGAKQYTPKESIKLSADLKTLPTDKTIVVYCYTGQTSAFLTAYLRVLGYDAKSLLFGANGMIYDLMESSGIGHQYSESEVIDGEIVE